MEKNMEKYTQLTQYECNYNFQEYGLAMSMLVFSERHQTL